MQSLQFTTCSVVSSTQMEAAITDCFIIIGNTVEREGGRQQSGTRTWGRAPERDYCKGISLLPEGPLSLLSGGE